jgi:RNA polymerase sigma factor (sigma-70 family)
LIWNQNTADIYLPEQINNIITSWRKPKMASSKFAVSTAPKHIGFKISTSTNVTARAMTNEALIEKYRKLVYYYIHRWTSKSQNYLEDFDDIVTQVFIKMMEVPLYGTRRHSKDYMSAVIRTAVSNAFRNLRDVDYHELQHIIVDDEILEPIQEVPHDDHGIIDLIASIGNLYQDFNIDEKLVLSSYLESKYLRKHLAIKEISHLIYKTPVETKVILESVLQKIRKALKSEK